MEEKYTIKHSRVDDHLRVEVVELGFVLETAPGKVTREDAIDAATEAIKRHVQTREKEALAS
jgi:hypothetical protein